MKRTTELSAGVSSTKRHRMPTPGPRLCDLPNAIDLLSDQRAEETAKEKGFLRNRAAKEKYEEVQRAASAASTRTFSRIPPTPNRAPPLASPPPSSNSTHRTLRSGSTSSSGSF